MSYRVSLKCTLGQINQMLCDKAENQTAVPATRQTFDDLIESAL